MEFQPSCPTFAADFSRVGDPVLFLHSDLQKQVNQWLAS